MQSREQIMAALASLDRDFPEKVSAAEKRERENRALAFYLDAVDIAGIPCRPLCLQDLRILDEAGNVFFCARPRLNVWESVTMFIWWQYAGRRDHWFSRRRFQNRLTRMELARPGFLKQEVTDYLDAIFQDSPASKEGNNAKGALPEAWCHEAQLIDTLGQRYAWATPERVLSMPLHQIRQLINLKYAEDCRAAGETPVFQALKSKSLLNDYINQRNALNAELAQTTTATA